MPRKRPHQEVILNRYTPEEIILATDAAKESLPNCDPIHPGGLNCPSSVAANCYLRRVSPAQLAAFQMALPYHQARYQHGYDRAGERDVSVFQTAAVEATLAALRITEPEKYFATCDGKLFAFNLISPPTTRQWTLGAHHRQMLAPLATKAHRFVREIRSFAGWAEAHFWVARHCGSISRVFHLAMRLAKPLWHPQGFWECLTHPCIETVVGCNYSPDIASLNAHLRLKGNSSDFYGARGIVTEWLAADIVEVD